MHDSTGQSRTLRNQQARYAGCGFSDSAPTMSLEDVRRHGSVARDRPAGRRRVVDLDRRLWGGGLTFWE
ncbi:hypothetical protein C5B89_16915 [Haloferax sp. Atlit-47N]|nr:hypothetical protein DEQ67_14185 [Haloferax sp. Atlit-48N]RDZ33750.1 hypothetical protein C5B88_18350 [Haloferax sp. Atlit-24N]RDZ35926.1 hypothetical protein C5B89_16915 [Haloferax sp. Atlit-47N]RLM34272.1 hypothetical protein DVK03_17130 [Haloferax sp. Atlit-109R]RLM41093.1 hypothetical protein DVK04_16945 [Haloferax sp. Atlit-105R]